VRVQHVLPLAHLSHCFCRCICCACKLVEVQMPSAVHYSEVPVAGPGFSGPVQVPPLGTSTDIATKFLATVQKETPTWEKEIKAAREKQEKVKDYRQSRKSDQGRKKQRLVRKQRDPAVALTSFSDSTRRTPGARSARRPAKSRLHWRSATSSSWRRRKRRRSSRSVRRGLRAQA
jgi:hypothetical protein